MASIERTAYPRFPRVLTLKDVQTSFTPRQDEIEWATKFGRGTDSRLALLVLLKCFLFLRYFPPVESIPEDIVEHVSASLGMAPVRTVSYANPTALYRHHKVIRELLGVEPYTDAHTRPLAVALALKAAAVVETRVDIINCVIEDLIRQGHELPVFRTLDDIAEQVHADAQTALHVQIEAQLSDDQRRWLDKLLVTDLPLRRTLYNQLKQAAKKTSRLHLDLLLDQVRWLDSLPACDDLLSAVPAIKLKHMAERAAVLDAGDLKDFTPPKRHTFILALIRQMRIRARDDVAEMFIRRIGAVHKRAREELQSIQARQRELSDALVATLEDVLDILAQEYDCATTGQMVRQLLAPDGTVDELRADCEAIRVWSGNNHLPLIWKPFSTWRHVMFRMANALQFEAATQDKRLLNALAVVLANEHKKAEWVEDDVDLSFASERWRKLVRRSHGLGNPTNRRFLEVCVFSHLSSDLRCGDICIEGSEAFADYRQQLLTWDQCKERLAEYCDRLDLATTAQAFVGDLKALLEETAQRVDQAFPEHAGDVVIGSNGEPTLRKVMARDVPASAVALQATIESRNPTRNLLDILANIEHWTGFTRHFGSLSGDDPKLKQARERYLLTVFAMGCNLGPTQAARHLSNGVTPHQLSYANQRHISLDQLDNACRDLTELYLRLDLPKLWGDGKKVAADGTQYDFYDQNLLVGCTFATSGWVRLPTGMSPTITLPSSATSSRQAYWRPSMSSRA